ncbi:MAG TPA: hypothetical protein VIJ18_08855 [Microbacteriaceae bacterium]
MSDDTAHSSGPLRLSGPLPLVVLALFIGTQSLLTLANLSDIRAPLPSIAALALIAAAATTLTVVNREPYPCWLLASIAAVVAAVTALVCWNLPDSGWPGYASWQWGAITFMLFLLALRGHIGWSWSCFAIMTAITVLWAVEVGRGALDGVTFVVRSAGLLLIATLFAVGLQRTLRRIDALSRVHLAQASREAVTSTLLTDQDAQLRVLDLVARPVLERVATGSAYTEDDRTSFLLAESLLRDRLRAPGLVSPPISDAVSAARRRGVEVLLMDDRGDHPLSVGECARIEDAIITAAAHPDINRLTARLLPVGRDYIATVATASAETSDIAVVRPDLARDGDARTDAASDLRSAAKG